MKQFSPAKLQITLTDAIDALSLLKEALYSSEIEMLLIEGGNPFKVGYFYEEMT
jgi:hypothetical protein